MTSRKRPLITFADFSDPAFRRWYETNHCPTGPELLPWNRSDWEEEEEPAYGSSDYCY